MSKLAFTTDKYTSYMESSQPGLNFSPVNRAEIVSRLHEFKFQLKPRMKSQPQAEQ
jgi:hypothetical protein